MNPKTMMFTCVFVGVLAAGMPQPSTAATSETNSSQIVVRLKESVKDKWGKLFAWSKRATTLREEMAGLPDSAWFSSDKKSHRSLIRDKVMNIRGLLLSTDAQEIMKQVDALDNRIAEIDQDIHKENSKSVFCPENGAKRDSALSKLHVKRRNLVCQREDAVRVVLRELEALGLKLSGGAAEQCLFMVDACNLIDAVVVAKSIGIVVENLRKLMATGDVASAKRYFGMYVVMVEVQKACFEIYLDKSRTGEWRTTLAQIKVDASEVRQKALVSAQDMSFNEQQRSAFKRNAEVNEATLNAVNAYEKILDQHEAVIQAKADEASKMLLVAENSYRTVSLTDEFLTLIKSNQDSFDALLQLQLPPIEIFNDTALQTEFAALTKRLKADGRNQ